MHLDEYYMQLVLEWAEQGRGRTSPNPLVGAVVVKDGVVVGAGYHQQAGTPHAEVHALAMAGERARGATLYVNLEPCSHYGLTPPCVLAVAAANVSRVVIGTIDPNPLVAGKGVQMLQEAGIQVDIGILADKARRLNEVFFKYIGDDLPFVALKTAMTLDGRIACANGDSRWVSGEESRKMVHELRDVYDAVLVGIGTVLADDPLLNTRLDKPDTRNPLRVIVDGKLELPISSQIADTAKEIETLVYTSYQADEERKSQLEAKGIMVIRVEGHPDQLDLSAIMRSLASKKITSVLVEGGGEINAAILREGLADKIYWFIAPKFVGNQASPGPVGGIGAESMETAWQIKDITVSRCGQDILVVGYL